MLREIKGIKQDEELTKRWFADDQFDLMLWLDGQDKIEIFLLSYKDETALSWNRKDGFGRHKVDSGETVPGRYKASPVLYPGSDLNAKKLKEEFSLSAPELEPHIKQFVEEKLQEFINSENEKK